MNFGLRRDPRRGKGLKTGCRWSRQLISRTNMKGKWYYLYQ